LRRQILDGYPVVVVESQVTDSQGSKLQTDLAADGSNADYDRMTFGQTCRWNKISLPDGSVRNGRCG
jgi:hypothetical protein